MPHEYKMVLLGTGGVGKTALTVQFVEGTFLDKYDPTIEDNYKKLIEVEGKMCTLEILDTAGTEQFTAMRDLYVRSGQGFILVYSITSRESFSLAGQFKERIELHLKGREAPLILAGNKADLEEQREVTVEEAKRYASEIGADFFETSAKVRRNVDVIFTTMVKRIHEINATSKQNPRKKTITKKTSRKNSLSSSKRSRCQLL
eukprot:TRINITY_DN4203_c0_g1_i1.p1 TRINITY_DN4203_c0_g1~~TRINITY_DN4203_c0_g1_i1.p1  ORF type:complete len:203 (+),score=22.14 TRINITY_DN4203_c0_g1_i1:63-671(+)